jgi:hypothetical protein
MHFLLRLICREQRALAARAHGSYEAVFTAAAFLHADHLRAEFRKQCRAIGSGDISPIVEHPYPFKNSRHRPILFFKEEPIDHRERSIGLAWISRMTRGGTVSTTTEFRSRRYKPHRCDRATSETPNKMRNARRE